MQNFRFHEPQHGPTNFKVELEVGGEVQHVQGVIAAKGETAEQRLPSALSLRSQREEIPGSCGRTRRLQNYSDEVILAQWASVIPKEHILRVGAPKGIIDVLLGALAIADGKVNLGGYLRDLRSLALRKRGSRMSSEPSRDFPKRGGFSARGGRGGSECADGGQREEAVEETLELSVRAIDRARAHGRSRR